MHVLPAQPATAFLRQCSHGAVLKLPLLQVCTSHVLFDIRPQASERFLPTSPAGSKDPQQEVSQPVDGKTGAAAGRAAVEALRRTPLTAAPRQTRMLHCRPSWKPWFCAGCTRSMHARLVHAWGKQTLSSCLHPWHTCVLLPAVLTWSECCMTVKGNSILPLSVNEQLFSHGASNGCPTYGISFYAILCRPVNAAM